MSLWISNSDISKTGKINPIEVKSTYRAFKTQFVGCFGGHPLNKIGLHPSGSQTKCNAAEYNKKDDREPKPKPEQSHQWMQRNQRIIFRQNRRTG